MVIVINDHKTLQIVTNHHNYSRLFIDSQIINSVHYYIVKYCECMKCMKCVKCIEMYEMYEMCEMHEMYEMCEMYDAYFPRRF